MAETYRLTPAQRRALDWLPSDGDWRMNPGRRDGIESLSCYFHRWVEVEYGDFGPRGGRKRRIRLTPAGVAAKKEITDGR